MVVGLRVECRQLCVGVLNLTRCRNPDIRELSDCHVFARVEGFWLGVFYARDGETRRHVQSPRDCRKHKSRGREELGEIQTFWFR